MDHFTHCPIPTTGGRDCWNESHPGNGYGICLEHWRKIVDQWMQDEPSVTIRCIHCDHLVAIDRTEISFAICSRCHRPISDVDEIASLLVREAERDASRDSLNRPGLVYYMRFGDRIKIGFTTNLRMRATQVPNDEVAAAEPGTVFLERERHSQFAPELISGQVEWFTTSPRLGFHIANVRDRYGDPFDVLAGGRHAAVGV